MKKLLVTLLVLVLIPTYALAAPQTIDMETMTVEELETLIKDANAQISALTPKPTPPPFTTYEKGSKGEGVKVLQQRLIDLKYLSGTADGGYGEKTALAVTAFQKAAGITPTGIADSDTQTALFDDDATENPEPPFDSSVFEKLNYKAVARDPSAYEGKLITFSGKIVQVSEGLFSNTLRIASKGSYDDILYCTYYPVEGESRFLEDDKVTVYAECTGIYTYETIMGGSVTIPSCTIRKMQLR